MLSVFKVCTNISYKNNFTAVMLRFPENSCQESWERNAGVLKDLKGEGKTGKLCVHTIHQAKKEP